jgi:hypothetical protein
VYLGLVEDPCPAVVDMVSRCLGAITEVGSIPATKIDEALPKGFAMFGKLSVILTEIPNVDASKKSRFYGLLELVRTFHGKLEEALDKHGMIKLQELAKLKSDGQVDAQTKIDFFFGNPTRRLGKSLVTLASLKKDLDFTIPEGELTGPAMLSTFAVMGGALCMDWAFVDAVFPDDATLLREKVGVFEHKVIDFVAKVSMDINATQEIRKKYGPLAYYIGLLFFTLVIDYFGSYVHVLVCVHCTYWMF